MGPIEMFKLYRLWQKAQAIAKEKEGIMAKLTQYVTLIVSLAGTLGVPTLAANWLHAHMAVYTAFVLGAIVLHAILPSIFSAPSAADQAATGVNKTVAILLMLGLGALCAGQLRAQTATTNAISDIQNIYAAGGSYSVNASPAVAGTALYARNLNTGANLPTFAFTVVDALPATLKPFTVTSNVGVGVAQQVLTLGKVPIYVPTAAGISWTGSNTGWQWNGGAIASIHLKGNYYLMPSVRFLKSSVSGGSGYQPIVGLLFAWGQ